MSEREAGLKRALDNERVEVGRLSVELESTYAHLRAVIENCKHSPVEAIRHQLVGLLPEVQTLPPDVAARMREKGMGNLVDRQEDLARAGWAQYGYGEEADTA